MVVVVGAAVNKTWKEVFREKENGYKNFQRMIVDFDQTKFAKAEKETLQELGR